MSTMSELDYSAYNDAQMDEVAPYRSLSRSAVISVVLAVLSLLTLIFPGLLVLPIVGAVLGLTALSAIRRYPNEYSGRGLAIVGTVLCSLVFVTSASWHAYEYYTEVPEGYERISFADLQPVKGRPEPIPPKAIDLQGEKVFLKGYMHPGVASSGKVNHFILVPDMGTCCFGGQPKPTDMIEVVVKDDAYRVRYAPRRIKLSGTFVVTPQPTSSLGLNGVWYHLEAETVQ
jgi:hypothetical protein